MLVAMTRPVHTADGSTALVLARTTGVELLSVLLAADLAPYQATLHRTGAAAITPHRVIPHVRLTASPRTRILAAGLRRSSRCPAVSEQTELYGSLDGF